MLPFVVTAHGPKEISRIIGWLIGAALIGLLWLGGSSIYDHYFRDEPSKNVQVLEGKQPPHLEPAQRSRLDPANEAKRQEEKKRSNFMRLTIIVIALLLFTALIFA